MSTKRYLEGAVGRRDVFRLAVASAIVVGSVKPVLAEPVNLNVKRKARYQANSAEVRNFYRVNSYPVR